MDYARVTPKARNGTSGINVEQDIEAGTGIWLNPPDRVAAITVAVHIPAGEEASFAIEVSCNRPETIGENGDGGYWDSVYDTTLTADTVVMLANSVTGIRVRCITAESTINVAFCG